MGELQEIKQNLKQVLDEMKETKKKKGFKFPWNSRVKGKKAKDNWITILSVNENKHIKFTRKQIDEQTIMYEGVPRIIDPKYVMYYKKNPLIILPSWSVLPFCPAENHAASLTNGSNTKGYKILLSKMHSEAIKGAKASIGFLKWIVGIGLAGIIVYALFTGGG